MIGVDTNVLVRLIVSDDDRQNAVARQFFAERSPTDPAFVGSVVLAETIWLLTRRLGYADEAVRRLLDSLLASDDFIVEHGDRLLDVLAHEDRPITQIADRLIAWAASSAGCSHTVTFDRVAARDIESMTLLA